MRLCLPRGRRGERVGRSSSGAQRQLQRLQVGRDAGARGSDRDAAAYCQAQVEDDNLPGLCLCENEDAAPEDPHDLGLISQSPLWFNYQTISGKQVHYGSFYRFVLTGDDLEQDFSVPGPYGH
jgi:hypothetical protein